MRIKTIFLLILPIITLFSCNKNNNSEFSDIPVIESYIKPGTGLSVKISRQVPFSSGVSYSSEDINKLTVYIIYKGEEVLLIPAGNGLYFDTTLQIAEGERIELYFTYNFKKVSAYTIIPSKPVGFTQSATSISVVRQDTTSGPPFGTMPDPIKLTWVNNDNSYYIVVIENIEEILDPIRDFGDDAPPGNRFRETPTASSGLQVRPMEFQYYGTHRLILYHVRPDYASLYESSSTSSQNLTNPSTSIINGYGIFTGLTADTLMIEVNED